MVLVLTCSGDASLAASKSSPPKKNDFPLVSSLGSVTLLQKPNAAFSQPEFAGYMPHRGDFETEYDNEAELILCDMAFHDDDTPVENGERGVVGMTFRPQAAHPGDLQPEAGRESLQEEVHPGEEPV